MEKSREISIKGIGKLSAKPDFVIVKLGLEETNLKYSEGYNQFADHMKKLQKLVEKIGFSKDELKASSISFSQYQEERNYRYAPKGYKFASSLKISFDFDSERLGKTLKKLSESEINPTINVRFTVKNKEEIKNKLLASAVKDAKTKAEILCTALDTKLGRLLNINYNWDEINIYSRMQYEVSGCFYKGLPEDDVIEFTPEEIDLTDDASFVWEIEG